MESLKIEIVKTVAKKEMPPIPPRPAPASFSPVVKTYPAPLIGVADARHPAKFTSASEPVSSVHGLNLQKIGILGQVGDIILPLDEVDPQGVDRARGRLFERLRLDLSFPLSRRPGPRSGSMSQSLPPESPLRFRARTNVRNVNSCHEKIASFDPLGKVGNGRQGARLLYPKSLSNLLIMRIALLNASFCLSVSRQRRRRKIRAKPPINSSRATASRFPKPTRKAKGTKIALKQSSSFQKGGFEIDVTIADGISVLESC